ncbi:MAG: long-chain fatty acid--CoA ligase, partial [Gammaproteobacteria bacterium]|nr:long-chain fatty acid--CoA ligase [Gammaproteobacteria bacterium]
VWGEAVTAFVVTKSGGELDYAELKNWCNERMSSYKIPKHVKRLDALPRNAMGKVTKPSLKSIPL